MTTEIKAEVLGVMQIGGKTFISKWVRSLARVAAGGFYEELCLD